MHLSRRKLLQTAAAGGAAALSAASYRRVRGANDRIGVGFIGYGLIGKRHVADFCSQSDVLPVGLAETHRGRLEEGRAAMGGSAAAHGDFRRLLDDSQVDAVVVSTPDHWHALLTMLACQAGKDVYVEKPLTLFVREGRWMVEVTRPTGRIVQVGTQQRSGEHYQRVRGLVREGQLGKIMSVRMQAARNVGTGFGTPPDSAPPAELNWDLWLGPAPLRPYNPLRAIYHFRWFWDYSGGQMTNLGAHSLDIVDWVLGLDRLRSVMCVGGRYANEDGGETPDTQEALFDCGDYLATWTLRECSRGEPRPFGLELFGSHGSLGISRSGFRLYADPLDPPANTIPGVGGHPVGGPQKVPVTGPRALRTRPIDDRSGNSDRQYQQHVRNFLDCIRSRKPPISDLESAHRAATACHLANISMRLGRQIHWDAEKETILSDAEAAGWLVRPYREPWDRELRALGIST